MVDGQTQIPLDVITFFLKNPQESSSNKRNNLYVFYHSDEAKPHRFSLAHTQSDLLFRRISKRQKPFDVPRFLPRLDTSLLYLKTKREREKRGGILQVSELTVYSLYDPERSKWLFKP